jgi:DNA end-binding protein Ku
MPQPRSIWNGTIAFGLVAVPVKVFSATESKTVHFREVHAKDGSRIEHRRICPKDGKVVDKDEIVKGYQLTKRKWVEVTDEEIAAAAGAKTRRLEVDHFVPAAEIDPVYYEKTYYLGAQDKGRDAYAMLLAALAKAGRAGVGRWVFHNRERTVVVRALEDVLALHTMRFADEVVPAGDIEVRRPSTRPGKREIDMAASLVESMHERFKPAEHEDEYREAVLAMIRRKAKGETIAPPEVEPAEETPDLMAALQASLDAGGGKKRRRTKAKS